MTSVKESLVLDGMSLNGQSGFYQTVLANGAVLYLRNDETSGLVATNVIAAQNPNVRGALLALSPKLYWRLDEPSGTVIGDSSGNGSTGTYSGITLNQASLIPGDANASVSIPNSGSMVADAYRPFLVGGEIRTFMVFANRTATTDIDSLFSTSSGSGGYGIFIAASSNDVTIQTVTGAQQTWTGAWPGIGVVVHVALVSDDTAKTAELFINGISQGVKTTVGSVDTANAKLGTNPQVVGSTFNGKFDEFAIFERALTAREIATVAAYLSPTGTYGSGVALNASSLLVADLDTAALFDGTVNSKVTTSLNPFKGNITIGGWANTTTLAAARNLFGGSAAAGPLVQIQPDGSVIWWSDLTAATQTWVAGTWVAATTYFWVLTWNNTTKVSELFLNAVSKGTKTSANAFNATPGNFTLAGSNAATGFLGPMDDTFVVSGVLTQAQIAALYTAGTTASTDFILQGYEVPPPNKRMEWAQGADLDGAALVRDPLFDNREVALRLRIRQQSSMDNALAQIAALSKKLEEAEQQQDGLPLVWTPANSTKTLTMYVLSGAIEGIPITKDGDDQGWMLPSPAPVVTVKLICKPYGYGTPVTSSTASSATPFVTATIAGVSGDAFAEGRILVTDAATQNRRYLEWGLEQRYYDPATSLLVDSDDMVITGFTGAQATRTGAYDPNATGNNVIRGTLAGSPITLCGTGNLGHVGTYRVKARIYTVANSGQQYVRLAWQEGDGPYSSNAYVSPPLQNGFCEVDLGLVTIPPKQLGTQRWQGRVEAYTTGVAGTDTLDLDYLVLVPAGEGYGKARAAPDLSASNFSAADYFATGLGAGVGLNGRVAINGTWATSGSTTDFVGDATNGTPIRSTNADASPRFGVLGPSLTNCSVTAALIAKTWPWSATLLSGIMARWTNSSNYIVAYFGANTGFGGSLNLWKVVAGVSTQLAAMYASYSVNTYWHPQLSVFSDGSWVLDSTFTTLSGFDADFATGGALQTGQCGIYDFHSTTEGSTATRGYDDIVITVPPAQPIVINAGRVAEIRFDGAIRQDPTGVYYGLVPYRGARFLVPPAGDKNRISRVLVKAHRNDIEAALSNNVTDNLTIQTIITPRYIAVPF